MNASAGAGRAAAILLRGAARENGLCAEQLLIDNEDGSGPQDYSYAVLGERGVVVTRKLNEPSLCACEVLVQPDSLPVPVRRARVIVKIAIGQTLFTGYLPTEPTREYAAGSGDCGGVYRAKLNAISDEWLLDKLGPAVVRGDGFSLGLDVRETLEKLTRQFGGTGLTISNNSATTAVLGDLALAKDERWSAQAGEIAAAGYASYRAMAGTVKVQPAGGVVHDLSDADGTLSLADFHLSQVREPANDVTVSGELEPTTYVTEVFLGDGVTTEFALNKVAFHPKNAVLLQDAFETESIDTRQWFADDPGGHLSITSAGLTMNGGNGVDGDVTLTALSAMEMGGSLLIELRGVTLGANSAGLLGGMYAGDTVLASCFVGYRVKQSGGATVIVPVVNAAEIGSTLPVALGHRYTLRMRLHCADTQRVMQRYSTMVDGVVQTFGEAGGVSVPMDVVFDLLDEGQGSAVPATVLYDSAAASGPVAQTPATCVFAAMNSGRLFGSISSVSVTRPGTTWVESTLPNGARVTRLLGELYEGVDCSVGSGSAVSGPGAVKFFPGRVPEANESVRVRYRAGGRAIARVADAASVAAEAVAGMPGTCRWVGKMLQPPARSSADCETAAEAILSFSTSRSAAFAGTYTWANPASDVWPGEVLRVTVGEFTTSLLVRTVEILCGREMRYRISFANDWGVQWKDGLGLRLSEAVSGDVALPVVTSSRVLASLGALQVVSLSETTIVFDAGLNPPEGGGFEVRRHDGGFGSGGSDLVLQSPVRTFSIPRNAQVERYFLRMYDASVPVRWSRFASAVFVDVPVE